jgi:hypothetical protein
MSLVVAIDVGIKNVGVCAYDFMSNKVTFWENVSLVHTGRYQPSQNVSYVRDFINAYSHLFANAFIVLIERQMRCNMRIIEAIFETLYFDKCHVIAPRSVKAHYGLSLRNYRANKNAAVEWVTDFVEENPNVFSDAARAKFAQKGKRDDLADALLLILYYLDTYSDAMDGP